MNTPIADFVAAYLKKQPTRFHMPGHKGVPFLGCEPLDLTEISGADVLYTADGIIHKSECNTSVLFGTAHSFYSTEGSSLAIRAMLALVSEDREHGRPLILAARNIHRTFISACALLDLDVKWMYGTESDHLCTCRVTAAQVEEAIRTAPRRPAAVYLTSPDYLGQTVDIAGIAAVCKAHGVPLLVDNAHGAYLRFLPTDMHPISLGATMCCDSAHKTLPVLTGGAYLHIARDAEHAYTDEARRMLSLFASTSPSYLILQSLDLANRYLAERCREDLRTTIERIEQVKARTTDSGFRFEASEPMKLVLNAAAHGYTGEEIAEHLRRFNVEAEFADGEYLVLMASGQNSEEDFLRIERAFASITPREPLFVGLDLFDHDHTAPISIREAMLGRQERIPAEESEGRICATPTVSCPPAIPVVICGERITKKDVDRFRRYGVTEVSVIRE